MNDKLSIIRKKIIPCVLVLLLCISVTACQKQAGSITVETDTAYSDNMKCILISEETKELTFDDVVKQKQKLLNKSEDQIKNMLSEKENLIRSELNENGKSGQDAVIHYYFIMVRLHIHRMKTIKSACLLLLLQPKHRMRRNGFILPMNVTAHLRKETIMQSGMRAQLSAQFPYIKIQYVWQLQVSLTYMRIICLRSLDFPYVRASRLLP